MAVEVGVAVEAVEEGVAVEVMVAVDVVVDKSATEIAWKSLIHLSLYLLRTQVTLNLMHFIRIVFLAHIFQHMLTATHRELDLFQLFIDEDTLERLVTSKNDYAEKNQDRKPNMYKRFWRHQLITDEMMRYLGCLLLLSINSVQNYRLAWSKTSNSS